MTRRRQYSNFSVAGILGFDERSDNQSLCAAAPPLYPSSETKTSANPEEDIFSTCPSPSQSPSPPSARPVPARDLNSTGESPSPPDGSGAATSAAALQKSGNTKAAKTSHGSSSKEPAKSSVATSSSPDPQPDLGE